MLGALDHAPPLPWMPWVLVVQFTGSQVDNKAVFLVRSE